MGGFETTEAIRALEADTTLPHAHLRTSTILNDRLPVIAVSASLPEKERSRLVGSGFGESSLSLLASCTLSVGRLSILLTLISFASRSVQTAGPSSPSTSSDYEG